MNRKSLLMTLILLGCIATLIFIPAGCKKRAPKPGIGQEEQTTSQGLDEMTSSEPSGDSEQSQFTEEEMMREKIAREKVDVLQDIRFDFDQWGLNMKSRATLSAIGDWLVKNPQIKILIEGHCDERGSMEYNLALGQKRANAAKEYLVDFGVSNSRLSTISYGEERPADSGHDETAWGQNRRAHFLVIED